MQCSTGVQAPRHYCVDIRIVNNPSFSPGLRHRVRLNAALASVIGVVECADAPPTIPTRALAEEYMARIDEELDRLRILLDRDLGEFNRLVADTGLPAVDMP